MTKTMTKTTPTTTTKTGYRYCVTDGTKRRPAGHIGYVDTREEALELRASKCRMGGYITREHR